MGAATGAAALEGFRVVLLEYILVVSTTVHRRWVRLLEPRRYVYMYVCHPGVCVAVAAAAGSGGARYFFHYMLDFDCSESRRASHAPASGESLSRECGDAALRTRNVCRQSAHGRAEGLQDHDGVELLRRARRGTMCHHASVPQQC